MSILQTIRGPIPVGDLGLMLPHEHLFTDLRRPQAEGYAQAEPQAVVRVMEPYLYEAEEAGVTVLAECSTVGVGRNVAVLQSLARSTSIHIIAPTGVYREGFVPSELEDRSVEGMAALWIRELREGIGDTGVRAGFIKLALSEGGATALEVRNMRAAVDASKETDAVIAIHTPDGTAGRRAMDLLEEFGLDLSRFIWVHANLETNTVVHLEAAERGAFVEFDAVGAEWQDQRALLGYTLNLIAEGYEAQILLSHDAGWFDPSQPDGHPQGNAIRGFTEIPQTFIPKLLSNGVSEDQVELLTQTNPHRAFSLPAQRSPDG